MDIILGRAGLTLHSPEVRWELSAITRWSEFWQQNCLTTVPKPRSSAIPAQLSSTLVESPEPAQVHTITICTMRLSKDVFSKQAATRLPPHRPWDCAIDLLPGTKLPKGRVYPLSILECKAMDDYIQEARRQVFIQPSTSPAASSCCFVGRRMGA